MRNTLSAVLLAALLIAGCSCRPRSDIKGGVNGTWEVASVDWGGTARPPGQYLELTIDGDRWEWKYTDPDSKVGGKCAIDPTTKPASIDMTTTEGAGAGDVAAGIYEVDGDTMKLAYGVKTKALPDRPRSFGGEGIIVLTLKRKK
jgi:uncharacterized protein (TIGR03067 family)